MTKIVFISDYFIDEILGGAEKCNAALIKQLEKEHTVEQHKSASVTLEFLKENSSSFFIIANFFQLPEELKDFLAKNLDYIIYEHDHKYVSTNNPVRFRGLLAPTNCLINRDFYESARNVICQSRFHAKILYQNLLIPNIINAAANFWDEADLEILSDLINTPKDIKYGAFETANKNKGMPAAIKYCNDNQLELTLIPHLQYGEFIRTLSRVENLVFFPQWVESYSRVAIEAKILGCKLITNKLLGVASEPYFKLNGTELLQQLRKNNATLIKKINKIIVGKPVANNFEMKEIPKITISCSLYKGEKYIRGFLEDTTRQTIFDKCELIIVNANSPENEEEIIFEYMEKYKNIKYHRLDYRATTTEAVNMVIEELATGEYITIGNVDDRRRPDCLEVQAKHLLFSKNVDLVYGDCLQTTSPNETYFHNTSNGNTYEHSRRDFSPPNMIKCLPGPMPMWKKSLHKKFGYFSHDFKYANDWDMWLRMVQGGTVFKKIPETLGLYYFNEEGNSTSPKNFKEKIKEENKIFLENKEVFGPANYNRYKNYFAQGN